MLLENPGQQWLFKGKMSVIDQTSRMESYMQRSSEPQEVDVTYEPVDLENSNLSISQISQQNFYNV